MQDREGTSALEYHERTKHSPASVHSSRHFLDWENQPKPFKIYTELPPMPLPEPVGASDAGAILAITSPGADAARVCVPTLAGLARLLHFSAGVTRKRTYPNGHTMYFRAAACTGALYHVDFYVVCGDLPGLPAGVYHFGPQDFSLCRLRAGDYRSVVLAATASEPAVARAPAVVVSTSTFWRNAWKYQSRTYRHCFWDNGTILANLFAVAAADDVPARLVMGFVDEPINHLLGLDTQREVALSLVTIGHDAKAVPGEAPAVPPLSLQTLPLSSREVDYPAIRAAHAASSLSAPGEVEGWRGVPRRRSPPPTTGKLVPLRPLPDPPATTLDRTILRRGSAREFAHTAISFEQLSTLLASATGHLSADFLEADPAANQGLGDLYLIVNAVDDLPSGSYVYHRGERRLELLKAGDFRRQAGHLDLGQALAADASVNFYVLVDLKTVVERFGNRGYRAAQLEAAIVGGKLYLAAYALGLGATGLTFFDDDVTQFFSPHAAGKAVMFLVALGHREKSGG
jgi:SagB-type dehydrogenase family enzyme